jgi:septum formation protein
MTLLLASTSSWRLQLLEAAGIPCTAVDPEVDEEAIHHPEPEGLARSRALAKATAVASIYPEKWVVGADQVAHIEGQVFGKPRDRAEWQARLRSLRGRAHRLTTGVALLSPNENRVFSVCTDVIFRGDLEDREIEAYMDLGEARDCAGGYMVERRGAWLVERCEGDWCNVIGLPVLHLVTELRAMGWRYPPEVG